MHCHDGLWNHAFSTDKNTCLKQAKELPTAATTLKDSWYSCTKVMNSKKLKRNKIGNSGLMTNNRKYKWSISWFDMQRFNGLSLRGNEMQQSKYEWYTCMYRVELAVIIYLFYALDGFHLTSSHHDKLAIFTGNDLLSLNAYLCVTHKHHMWHAGFFFPHIPCIIGRWNTLMRSKIWMLDTA